MILLSFKMNAQGCLPGEYTFKTQGQIDSFAIQYPGCTKILGSIIIQENETGSITNLEGLLQLDTILGNVWIGKENISVTNTSLTNLIGLKNVKYIGGSLLILGNNLLTSLNGLTNLDRIGDILAIDKNPSLLNLQGLEKLAYVDGGLHINRNSSLLDVQGLNNLRSVGEGISISQNDMMINLNGFDSLKMITGFLRVTSNPVLTNLSGLNNLESVLGLLRIDGNKAMTSLEGLNNLRIVKGSLLIYQTNALVTLNGLNNLTSIGGDLQIVKNSALKNLKGLGKLTSVEGYFFVRGNTSLVSFAGIDNITRFGKSIVVDSNYLLSNCEVLSICLYLDSGRPISLKDNSLGCNSITEIQEACESSTELCFYRGVLFNSQAQIDSFASNYPGCNKIGGKVTIQEKVAGNITNLQGLAQIDTIFGGLQIGIDSASTGGNKALKNLKGLENLKYVGKFLFSYQNTSLTSLIGLNNLKVLDGTLLISNNNSLENLKNLDSLEFIGGYVALFENESLKSLNGLENLSAFGALWLGQNHSLKNLDGLENLTSLNGLLGLFENDSLTNLSGLINLNSINGELHVYGNKSLRSLKGLENVSSATITNMEIGNNPRLSFCNVKSICDYLQTSGPATIQNNADGCNDIDEIIESCKPSSAETLSYQQDQIIIFPNPTEDLFTIVCRNECTFDYSIYSSGSGLIKSGEIKGKGEVDISSLPPGLYFVEIFLNNQVEVKKLLKTL